MNHHFVQFNVAWLKKPFDHPDIADFKNAIDPIHELADRAPGFVWRLIADGHSSATALRPLGEDGIINFTIWESRKAMAAWVYRGEDHSWALKRRRDWFHPPMEPNVVMWWIPAGDRPTLEDALDRLQYLRSNGPTPLAFTFKQTYAPEDADAFLKKPGMPRLNKPRIGPAQAARCIDAYVAAWNELETSRRVQMLSQVLTDDSVYCDPSKLASSRAAIVDHIAQVQASYPGGRVVRTSAVDVHHFTCRFNWRMIRADSTELPESVDFVDFTRDGRIRRVTGFFGPLSSQRAS